MLQYRPYSRHDLVTTDYHESVKVDQGSGLLTHFSLLITLSCIFIFFSTVSIIEEKSKVPW